MIAETVILLSLHLPLPPTWISLPSDEIMRQMRPGQNLSVITPTSISSDAQTVGYGRNPIFEDRRAYLALQSPDDARRSAIIELSNRVSGLRADLADTGEDDCSPRSVEAIRHVLEIIEAIPSAIPLPRPMLLAEQVALFWDFGGIYAELDVSPDGIVSVYGKHPRKPEMFLDTDLSALAGSGGMFPESLKDFLLPA